MSLTLWAPEKSPPLHVLNKQSSFPRMGLDTNPAKNGHVSHSQEGEAQLRVGQAKCEQGQLKVWRAPGVSTIRVQGTVVTVKTGKPQSSIKSKDKLELGNKAKPKPVSHFSPV